MTRNQPEKRVGPRTGLWRAARARTALKRAYEQGLERVGYDPLFLWIEPTNRCNLRCPMCPQSDGLKRPFGTMDLQTLERVLAQESGRVQQVSLHFGGEPLLHENIHELVRMITARGAAVIMHSNATRINAALGEKLIRAGLDQIVFSFDAVPFEDYEKKRPPARANDTLERIRDFLAQKKRMKSHWPIVTIKALDFYAPGKTLTPPRAFTDLFQGLPVDRFVMEWAHTFSGGFAENVARENRYALRGRDSVQGCVLPWYGFAIAWDGAAYACCNDLNGEYSLGNVREQPIGDIWNGAPMQTLRRGLAARDPAQLPLCVSCEVLYRGFPPKQVYREGLNFALKHIIRPAIYRT